MADLLSPRLGRGIRPPLAQAPRRRRRPGLALSWPHHRRQGHPPRTHRNALATLEYSYILEDKHRYGKYTHEFPKKPAAEEFVRTMKDKQVQIRYKPSNPDKSVLEQRTIEQYILLTPRFG